MLQKATVRRTLGGVVLLKKNGHAKLWGTGVAKSHTIQRTETRYPIEVAVRIAAESRRESEQTFTENVSDHGARVLSTRRWQREERLQLSLLSAPGVRAAQESEQHAIARVAYCERLPNSSFAIGVEFLESASPWTSGLTGNLGAVNQG